MTDTSTLSSVEQRVRSEQIRVLYRSTPIGLFAALTGAFASRAGTLKAWSES